MLLKTFYYKTLFLLTTLPNFNHAGWHFQRWASEFFWKVLAISKYKVMGKYCISFVVTFYKKILVPLCVGATIWNLEEGLLSCQECAFCHAWVNLPKFGLCYKPSRITAVPLELCCQGPELKAKTLLLLSFQHLPFWHSGRKTDFNKGEE